MRAHKVAQRDLAADPSTPNVRAGPAGFKASLNFDRLARVRGLLLLAFLLSILGILIGMIVSNLVRSNQIQGYVAYSHRIQNAGMHLQQVLTDMLSGHVELDKAHLEIVSGRIQTLRDEDAHLSAVTPSRLGEVLASLTRAGAEPLDKGKADMLSALRVMHEILDNETDLRERVLEEIGEDELADLTLATGTLLVLLVLGAFFLRSRVFAPLHDMRHLLLNLAKEDYSPIETDRLDPLLVPVFNSYNVMVAHLGELEEAKRMHAQSLEAEVRAATQALLEQQRDLARAERLAAVGELAAGLAHELRNPLAGIQMSCDNLRTEVQDEDQCQRLDLMGAELKRMTRLLNELLDQGKQSPVASTRFNLLAMVRELMALTRYQIPSETQLHGDIAEDLFCFLPESALRQALLNLILNSSQALDGAPGLIQVGASTENGTLLISVSDNGPGFSADMLSKGIRNFGSERPRGIGLGLAIVQRFAREAGGGISLANLPSGGAVVTLSLPDAVVQS